MPQRFLRPGITNSDRWNSVEWDAQSLYIRLLTLVDDFGRYDGRPSVICGNCFSVWNEKHPESAVNPQRTAALCQQLAAAKLLEFYDSGERSVVQVTQWQERTRSEHSKWPDRDSNPLRNPAESCGILPPSSLAIAIVPSSPSLVPRPSSTSVHTLEAKEGGTGETKRAVTDFQSTLAVGQLFSELRKLFNRPDERPASYEEEYLLAEITRRPDWKKELREISDFYSRLGAKERTYFPHSLTRLVRTWQDVLDQARVYEPNPRDKSHKEKELDAFLKRETREMRK